MAIDGLSRSGAALRRTKWEHGYTALWVSPRGNMAWVPDSCEPCGCCREVRGVNFHGMWYFCDGCYEKFKALLREKIDGR